MHPLQKAVRYRVESRCAEKWNPHILARAWNRCNSKCRHWSVVMVRGHPKRAIHPYSRVRATVSAVMYVRGMASGQRVKRSNAVRQYLKLFDVGNGPTMSTCTCWKRDVIRAKFPSGVVVCLVTFDRWQDWHTRVQMGHYLCMPGHT
jgi:hypothetical protein